jgi:ABC-type transport system involved in multi-copper enzyme maturation permease subunit
MRPLTAKLLAAELLKVRKRWLPWVLLFVMLFGTGFQIWIGGFLSWKFDEPEYRDASLRAFVLPWAIPSLLDSGQYWGSFFVGILTASAVATEHNWGTVRQALIRGQTRSGYLTVKLVGLVLLSTIGLLVTLAFGVIMALIATSAAGEPVTLDAPGGGPSVAEIALMVLRAGYAVIPYGLLAFCLTVVSRSTTLGVVGTFLYLILESIVVAILRELGGPAPDINSFLLGHNVSGLLAANTIGTGDFNTISFRDNPFPGETPNPWTAAVAIAVYSAAFLFIAYSVFRRRDLGVDSGAG